MFRTPIARLKWLGVVLLAVGILVYATDPAALGPLASGIGALFVAIITFFKTIIIAVYHAIFGATSTPSVHL